MKIDKVNSWLALGANFGVLIGIFVLVIEVQNSTTMARATVQQDFANGSMDITLRFAEQAEIVAKIFSTSEPRWESPVEEIAAEMIMTSVFRAWENGAWMIKEGLMDEAVWRGLVEDMRFRATFPYCVEQWHTTRMRFSVDLQETLDPIFGTGA